MIISDAHCDRVGLLRLRTRRRLATIAACNLALWAASADAAEWSVERSVRLRGEYDNNIALTTAPHESVIGALLLPQVKANYETEVILVSATGALNVRRYNRDSTLDSTDVLTNAGARYKYETGSYGLVASYVKDTTRDSELAETGQAPQRRERQSIEFSPDWSQRISDRTELGFGYRYSDVSYEHGAFAGFVDYRYQTLSSTLQFKVSPRDDLTTSFSHARYDPSEPAQRLDDTTLRIGLVRLISEVLRGSAGIGVARISGPGASDGDRNRVVGNASLDLTLETGAIGFKVAREINPSGSASLAQVDRAAFEWSRRLRETVSIEASLAAYRTRFVGSMPLSDDSRYQQFETRLAWLLSRDWALEAGYAFRRLKYDAATSAATGHTVYVTGVYTWPKIAASR